MEYNYEDLKRHLFSEAGQVKFLRIKNKAKLLLEESGAAKLKNLVQGVSGHPWLLQACVERLVELNEIQEVPTFGSTKHRIFTL